MCRCRGLNLECISENPDCLSLRKPSILTLLWKGPKGPWLFKSPETLIFLFSNLSPFNVQALKTISRLSLILHWINFNKNLLYIFCSFFPLFKLFFLISECSDLFLFFLDVAITLPSLKYRNCPFMIGINIHELIPPFFAGVSKCNMHLSKFRITWMICVLVITAVYQ